MGLHREGDRLCADSDPSTSCPHQPGHCPALSELDGQRWVRVSRSHQQPQARQGDESSLEFIQGSSQEQQKGPETIQERQ